MTRIQLPAVGLKELHTSKWRVPGTLVGFQTTPKPKQYAHGSSELYSVSQLPVPKSPVSDSIVRLFGNQGNQPGNMIDYQFGKLRSEQVSFGFATNNIPKRGSTPK